MPRLRLDEACQSFRRIVGARDADALTSPGANPDSGILLQDFRILDYRSMSSPALSNGTQSESIARAARLSRYVRHLLSANPVLAPKRRRIRRLRATRCARAFPAPISATRPRSRPPCAGCVRRSCCA